MRVHLQRMLISTAILVAFGLRTGQALAFAKNLPDPSSKDILIKLKDKNQFLKSSTFATDKNIKIENLGLGNWLRVQIPQSHFVAIENLKKDPNVLYVQPNYKFHLIEDVPHSGLYQNTQFLANLSAAAATAAPPAPEVKPDLPVIVSGGGRGTDPLYKNQWGMQDLGVKDAWKQARGKGVIVAVIDSGVDYTHEDLLTNVWRNPGEMGFDSRGHNKSNNGIDDDGNGYIDDVMGWDFVDDDNKPYDVHAGLLDVILKGENPGHGTHCAGNVAAQADNGKGTVGVAPEAQIMALRFISKQGQGTTADAIRAIVYALNNGARVLSNSWGSEGEDPQDAGDNQALKEAITGAQEKGAIFVFAAGNGHQGVGYDNDTDPKPALPASFPIDNIISVAAIDSENKLGPFSNWGLHTVHIAAPGVKIFSTTVDSTYNDTIIDIFGLKATWDGTSMAAPHVAGAVALYLSKHPDADWRAVKAAVLETATPLESMKGKSVSGGKLNVKKLLER